MNTGGKKHKLCPHSDNKDTQIYLDFSSSKQTTSVPASLPVQQIIFPSNMDTHVADFIKIRRSAVSNTTYSHMKHISHLRVSAANTSPHCSSPRWSQSPAGCESRSDESFRWISSGALLVWGKSCHGWQPGEPLRTEKSVKHNEPHGSWVYVHRPTPAFCLPGTLSTTASVPGELGSGGDVYLRVFSVCVYTRSRWCIRKCACGCMCVLSQLLLIIERKLKRGKRREKSFFSLLIIKIQYLYSSARRTNNLSQTTLSLKKQLFTHSCCSQHVSVI